MSKKQNRSNYWYDDFLNIMQDFEVQKQKEQHSWKNFTLNLTPQKSFPHPSSGIVNLSSRRLGRYEMSVLSRGLMFVPSPTNAQQDLIQKKFVDYFQKLRKENFEKFIRCKAKIDKEIEELQLPLQNMCQTSRIALLDLLSDENIKIMKADKGHQIVVLNIWDYDYRVQQLLNDKSQYQKLNYVPTIRYQFQIEQYLNKIKDEKNLSQEFIESLIVQKPKPPSIYCLPKLHKDDYPFRPIISSVNSPDYLICKHISKVLQKLVAQSPTIILNIYEFVDFIQKQKLQENEVMVNFDVAGMFTNINVDKSIDIVLEQLKSDITFSQSTLFNPEQFEVLLKLTSKSTFFHFQGEFFEQLKSFPMGKPSSPAICNLFMENFEKLAFEKCTNFPRIWKRYQDDIFAIIQTQQLENFLVEINNIDPDIKLVHQIEQDGRLAFLDVMVFRNIDDGCLQTKVFRRTSDEFFHTIDFNSYQDINIKKGLVKSLFIKAKKYCSDKYNIEQEQEFIYKLLKENNYPNYIIKKIQEHYESQSVKHKKKKSSKKNDFQQIRCKKPEVINIPYNEILQQNLRKIGKKFDIHIKSQQYSPLHRIFQMRKVDC